MVGVSAAVDVEVGILVSVDVDVEVGVLVLVGVNVEVIVGVLVPVGVTVTVGVRVLVGVMVELVGVGVAVGLGMTTRVPPPKSSITAFGALANHSPIYPPPAKNGQALTLLTPCKFPLR